MNYGQLKAAIKQYLHRDDLDALFPIFLEFAEQRIYYGEGAVEPLRLSCMMQVATMADGTQPALYIEAKKVGTTVTNGTNITLSYRPLDRMPYEVNAFSWQGQTMVLSADVTFPVEMTYYAKLVTPVADGDTNWLLTNAPNVYMYAMTIEAAKWSRDDALFTREASNYVSAAGSLQTVDQRALHSGSLLTQKTRGQGRNWSTP